jgi:predicted ribosome quality control (RQC) complex YloA/Tae2 family protein
VGLREALDRRGLPSIWLDAGAGCHYAARRRRMASKGRPFRAVNVEGWEVLVGRGDEDHDHLTFHVAEPHDLWLHVGGGTPGSHVLVRNPGKGEVPRSVLERAAQLAAWFSKARGAARVEVHFCRAGDVSKPRGAPTGLVELARYKSLKVKPEPPAGAADS